MNERQQENPDPEAVKSRIVRALYDATEGFARRPDLERDPALRRTLAEITLQADALGDPDFSASFRAALRHLLRDGPARRT